MIAKAVRFLAEQGFLTLVSAEGVALPQYAALPLQVRELAANAAFRELLELGVVTVADPSGSLRVVNSDQL